MFLDNDDDDDDDRYTRPSKFWCTYAYLSIYILAV